MPGRAAGCGDAEAPETSIGLVIPNSQGGRARRQADRPAAGIFTRAASQSENHRLSAALNGVTDFLKASIGSGIRIHFELEADIPLVKADLNQIELVVLNLAINAKEAMRDGRTVIIRTSVQPAPADLAPGRDYAVISVIGPGEGINPALPNRRREAISASARKTSALASLSSRTIHAFGSSSSRVWKS